MTETTPRVLMVAPVAVLGGAGQVFMDLVVNAAAGGYTPFAVFLRPGPLIERFRTAGIPYGLIDAGRLRNIPQGLSAIVQLRREIRQIRPHMIFATEPRAHLYCAPSAWRTGVATGWRQPALPSRRDVLTRVVTALPAQRVLVASRTVAASQMALPHCPPVSIIHPGVALDRLVSVSGAAVRAQAGIPGGVPLVGIVGRLQPWKGQHVFLRAARLVLDSVPDAWFAVVGGAEMGWEKGDYPGDLQRLARTLAIEDRVVFTGHSDFATEWTAALDVAVNASDPEPFGLVVIEAMALGVTMVALAAGGPLDIITHSVDGLLAASPTPEAFAHEIVRALKDATLRHRLGEAAQETVRARFTVERMAVEFGDLIRDVLRP